MRELYTMEEVTLCTYGARFDVADIGGVEKIRRIRERSAKSVTAKIQNIAAMLDEECIARESRIAPLTGRPPGKSGRRTNWWWVQPLASIARPELFERCRSILLKNERRK